ncbi:MAG: hypothetical protein ACK58T_08240 [Phycisphaerae bacterium]
MGRTIVFVVRSYVGSKTRAWLDLQRFERVAGGARGARFLG